MMDSPHGIPRPHAESNHYQRLIAALGSAKMTRRSLLLGLAAGPSSLLPLVGYAARAATNFSVHYNRRLVELAVLGVPAWRLDTQWFDGDPLLSVVSTQDRLRVELRNAFFPGTNIPALLRLQARRNESGWDGELLLPALGFNARMSFAEWLIGLEPATGALELARAALRATSDVAFTGLSGRLQVMPDWTLLASRLDGGVMEVTSHAMDLVDWRLTLPAASSVEPEVSRRTWLWCDVDGHQTIPFGGAGPELALRGARGFIDASSLNANLTFAAEGEVVGGLRWSAKCCVEIPAQSVIATRSFGAQGESCIAQVTPLADRWVRFNGGAIRWAEPAEMPILVASAAQTDLLFRRATPAADRFIVALPGTDQAIFERRGKEDAPPKGYPAADLLDFARYDIPLDAYDLVVRRAIDGLFCRVRFRNVHLQRNLRGWYLSAQKTVAAGEEPLLEFDFGSQHLREEAVYFTDWCLDGGPPLLNVVPVPDEVAALALIQLDKGSYPNLPHYDPSFPIEQFIAELKSDSNRKNYEAFRADLAAKGKGGAASPTCKPHSNHVARHEPAGSSHLLFRMKVESLPLGMESLFCWASATSVGRSNLEPVLSRRAAPQGVLSLDNSLLNEEVTNPASLAQPRPADADPGKRHHEYATRIEAPAHLVVSPIPTKNGDWRCWIATDSVTGSTADQFARAELWSVRMSSVEMRALYSDCMSFVPGTTTTWGGKAAVFSPPPPYNSANPRETDFRASYDSRDLHELVCLTAVYKFEALCGSKQVQCCAKFDSGPTVNPHDADMTKPYPPGFFMPEPMRAELLMLTSQGATFRYRGTWSPPASNKKMGALTLKRYDHDVHLGRDSYTRMEYKGFLFPLGQPAILCKETRRRFCLEGKTTWVARLVQRFFIHVPAFKRSFRAIGQVHDRLWGHAETGMRSFTTPDLAKPERCEFLPGLGAAAFWPRVPRDGGLDEDVIFEFEDSLTSTSYAAPLVFVDNHVAHNKKTLEEVVNKWRKQVKKRKTRNRESWQVEYERYFATVTSAKLPYVPGERSENTNIETRRILLGVAAPLDEVYDDEPVNADCLIVTPRMEADDQPPFYPVRRRALIASTQLAVLTGSRASQFLMEFDPVYLKHGLDDTHNGAKIFGVFVDKTDVPHMNFGKDTSRSGGFASPSAKIVWMSRSRGPIGGPEDRIVPLGESPTPLLTKSMRTQRDAEAGHADDFNPKEYFGQVLGDAKLLGVVRLVDVLEVLLVATGTEVPTIRRQDLYDLALPALRSALDFIGEQLQKPKEWFQPGHFSSYGPEAIAADRLRPDWERLVSSVTAAGTVVNSSAPDLGAIFSAANELGAACDGFAASVRGIVNDPVVLLPDALRQFIKHAHEVLNALKQLMPPKELLKALRKLALGVAESALREKLRTLIAELATAPEYARVDAALVRVAKKLDELEEATQDAQKALAAWSDDLFSEIDKAVREVAEQLACFEQLAAGACTSLAEQVKKEINAQAKYAFEAAAGVAEDCAVVTDAVERAIAEHENSHPAQSDLHAAARRTLALLSNILNAEADALGELKRRRGDIENWPGPCADRRGEALHSLGRDAIEYVLLAPERAQRCLAAFEQIGQGLPKAYAQLAAQWLTRFTPHALLARCRNALSDLARVLPQEELAFFVRRLNDAVKAAESLGQRYESLSALAECVLKKDVAAAETLRAEIAAIVAAGSAQAEEVRMVVEPVQDLLSALRALSPQAAEAAVRAAVQERLTDVRLLLETRVRKEVENQLTVVGNAVCAYLKTGPLYRLLNELVPEQGQSPVSSYLSSELRTAVTALRQAIDNCAPDVPDTIGEILKNANQVWDLLSRAASSGDIGQLADLESTMRDIIAQLGVPTRVKIDYDWNTTVTETPRGNAAIFEPLGDRTLTIAAVIEASRTGGRPSVSLDARLSPFAIHLFGKTGAGNFLSIHFDALNLTARPGQALECKTDVTLVKPGAALGFIDRLSSLFGGRSGFYLLPSAHGIEVGYRYSKPYDILGGFIVQNIDFSITASLPFDNSPVRATLKLAEKEKPFLISAGIYGGGGFLGLRTRADTLELLEASFEYGAVTGFGFGPVTGSGRITAGIYIRMGGRSPLIEGFFCAAGEASVAGLINVSAMLRVSLRYQIDTGQMAGNAVFTFKFSLGIFDYSYSANVTYAKSGDGGGGQVARRDEGKVMLAALGRVGSGVVSDGPSMHAGLLSSSDASPSRGPERHHGLLELGAWKRYWAAFSNRSRSVRHEWMTLCCTPVKRAEPTVSGDPIVGERAQGLERVIWYVVPWGKNGSSLRAGLRAMPIVLSENSPARTEWPRLLANTSEVNFALFLQNTTFGYLEYVTKSVNVGERYRARLAEWGLTIDDAQRLWSAIFPTELGMPKCTEVDCQRGQGKQRAYHDSGVLAAAAGRTAGLVFADSVECFDMKAPAAKRNHIEPTPASGDLRSVLSEIAATYVPVTGRAVSGADAKSKQAFRNADRDLYTWVEQTMLDSKDKGLVGGAGSSPYPFSTEAFNTIFSNREKSLGGGEELRELNNELARQFVWRQVAYVSSANCDQAPEDNFHRRLAGLVSHPWLMKVLGLVVDIEIESAAEVDAVCVDSWGPDIKPRRRMRTALDDGYAKSSVGNAKGLLDVSARSGRFSLTQLDSDRTSQRLMQTAVSWRNEILSGLDPAGVSVTLQPQETVGLSLVEHMEDKEALRSEGPEIGEYVEVHAEQLTVGIRPDIQALIPNQDPAGAHLGPYTSLTARRIRRVRLHGRDITEKFERLLGMVDEGMIVEAVRELIPNDPKSSFFVEGERFRWGAWVIGVPRPDADGAPRNELPDGTCQAPSADSLRGLVVEYEACPGATPQRYGHGYRVGVRQVMADGNSRAIEDAEKEGYPSFSVGDGTSDNQQQGHAPFLRYEPIAPPAVLIEGFPRSCSLRPEKAHRAVVTLEGKAHSRRVLVPPRCANIELAIRHGMFDEERMRDEPPQSAFANVVMTPEGEFPSFLFAYAGVNGDTEERYFRRLPGGTQPPSIPYYPDPWARRAILAFYRASDDRLLYIDHFDYYPPGRKWPDAQELEIEIIPSVTVADPVRGFEIACEAGRRIVRVAPGVHLKLRAWHEMDWDMLNQSAVVDQIVQAAADPKVGNAICDGLEVKNNSSEEIRACVLERLSRWGARRDAEIEVTARPVFGCSSELLNTTSFWMLNPLREIDILHAVPVPLQPALLSDRILLNNTKRAIPEVARSPSFTSTLEEPFLVARKPAETTATFKGHVRLDRATTSHVDAQCHWRDNARIAASGKSGSKVVKVEERQGLLFQLRQIAPIAMDTNGRPPRAPISVELDARQYLQSLDWTDEISNAEAAKLQPITTPYDFGDTRARVLDVSLLAQARHAIEFQPGQEGTSETDRFTRRSLPQRVIVQATQRPEPPRIEYILPLLGWKNVTADRSARRIREAGWFRVWLGDEWYSSGNGELLAVVCWPSGLFTPLDRRYQLSGSRTTPQQFAPPDKRIEPFITRWGLDPLAPQFIEFGNMPASALRNRLRHRAQLSEEPDDTLAVDVHHLQDVDTFEPLVDLSLLPDLPNLTGSDAMKAVLALYRPRFNRASGRWFADIQMDPQYAYKPFVRLALARWQPHALHDGKSMDLRLSRIVTSEFVQLLPGRSVTITPVASVKGWREYELAISGTMLDGRSGAKTEWHVGIDQHHWDRAGGTWVPLENQRDKDGVVVQGISTPLQRDGVILARVRVPDKVGARYSVVFEEIESLAGACAPSAGRLVFFDRVVLER
jgi:hypothetical protein